MRIRLCAILREKFRVDLVTPFVETLGLSKSLEVGVRIMVYCLKFWGLRIRVESLGDAGCGGFEASVADQALHIIRQEI